MTGEPGVTQANILRFITSYIERHGYGPTIREIAEGVGCATSNAHRHVGNLARKGKIVKNWRQARSIQLPGGARSGDRPEQVIGGARSGDRPQQATAGVPLAGARTSAAALAGGGE